MTLNPFLGINYFDLLTSDEIIIGTQSTVIRLSITIIKNDSQLYRTLSSKVASLIVQIYLIRYNSFNSDQSSDNNKKKVI